MKIKFIILGCGSSLGVPRADGNWGKCDPKEKKNLINNPDYSRELKDMRMAWRKKINYARGEGKAKILRYTFDSKAEQGNITMPK